MKNFEVKITGSGTADQLAARILEVARALQIANAFNDYEGLTGAREDGIISVEIKEDN